MERTVELGSRTIGEGHAPYIIAEIGSNHNGDLDLCRRLIDAAQEVGADAVKFQSWSKGSLISRAEYARNTQYEDTKKHFGSLEEMVEAYQLTPKQHREVADYCREKGVTFLSSAFSPEEVELLEEVGVVCHKVASMDINHLVLLEAMARTGKPILLSTGMATLAEVDRAISVLAENGAGPVVPLHCISIYPPRYEDINLRNVPMLRTTFDAVVGFSDHSIGSAIPLAAIALGAAVIEKHFTIDKDLEGWDHAISADPPELRTIVEEGRNVATALGTRARVVSAAELEKRKKFRRRIVLRRAVPEGHILTMGDLDYKRPGNGIHPDEAAYVAGRKTSRALEADHELEWRDLV